MNAITTPEIIQIYQQLEKFDTSIISLAKEILEFLQNKKLDSQAYCDLMNASDTLDYLKKSVLAEIGRIVIENHENE